MTNVVYGWQRQRGLCPAEFVKASGVHLWDVRDRRYLDLCSGQVNVNVGYSHPHVLAAMHHQMDRMAYVAPTFATAPRSELAALTAARAPGALNYVFFSNSGSEAVEVALKLARAVTGRNKIYSAWRSYHGATAATSGISGDPRRLFAEPTAPGLRYFHGATCYRCAFGRSAPPECGFSCLESLRAAIELDGPETVAAILLEPITGTSGLYIPPLTFLQGVRQFCDAHGILLIFDETMTGWGRTGRWFACEHFNVVPDILTTAKGITSGYVPLGATVMTPAIRDFFLDRTFVGGSTNEGHTLACATGVANLQVYESENLIERSRILGEYLLSQLEEVRQRHISIGEVRGKGLFACLELTSDRSTRSPIAGYRDERSAVSSELTRRLLEVGVLVIAKWDYLFIAPALTIDKGDLDDGLEKLDHVLTYTDQLVDARLLDRREDRT